LAGEEIALPARIAQVAADAALFDRVAGGDGAVAAVQERAGTTLDPALAAEFCRRAGSLLEELRDADALEAALEVEPRPPLTVSGRRLDDVCRAFGDVVDLKTPLHHGHSAGVAELAAA